MSCLTDTETPWREVHYMMIRLPRTWAATILRSDCKEMGTNGPLLHEVPKTTKMTLVRPLMASWRWPLEMAVLFLHVAPHPSPVHKSSHPLLVRGRGASAQVSTILPRPGCCCFARSPSPRSGKKTPWNNATCNRGIYYWLEPGPPALTKGVRTKGPEPQFSQVFIGYNY